MYYSGITIGLLISIAIFLLFWSEAIRQLQLWINDNDGFFEPWIKKNKKFNFIVKFIPDEAFSDKFTYFCLVSSMILPILLIIASILWPISFIFLIISFFANRARDRKRAKKRSN